MKQFLRKCLSSHYSRLFSYNQKFFVRTLYYIRSMKDFKNKHAILLYQPGEEKFTFSYHLQCDNPKIDKQFNTSRNADETMEAFLNRMKENLRKQFEKKKSKKAKKSIDQDVASSDDMSSSTPINVEFKNRDNVIVNVDEAMNMPAKSFLMQNGLKMNIFSASFDIYVNPPMVQNAKLSDVIFAGFMIYPFKLDVIFGNRNDSIFTWYVTDKMLPHPLKTSWTEVSNGFLYTVPEKYIGNYVKLEIFPKDGTRVGPEFEVISKNPITAGPGKCPFEDRHEFTKEKLNGSDEFRVVTYNLLADLYADSEYARNELFAQCPSYAIDISYRKNLFVKELIGYNADIMCLQEVDKKIYEGDLHPIFSNMKFDGLFGCKDGSAAEGTACFWNTDKFQLRESSRTILREIVQQDDNFKDILEVLNKNEKLKETFMDRNTISQTVVLDSKVGNQGLIVGTTHLFWRPDADHIRLLQVGIVMRILENFAKKMSEENPTKNYSILLCGDFNSTPPFGVLEFMRNKIIDEDYRDWKSAEGEEITNFKLEHSFNMDSACGTPIYTNYTLGFKDCLDYIFYQTDSLEVKNVIPFPTEEELSRFQAIPNQVFPSDHIACVSDLKWKN